MKLSAFANRLSKLVVGLWRVSIHDGVVYCYSGAGRFRIQSSSVKVDGTETDVRLGNWRPMEIGDLKQMVAGASIMAVSGGDVGKPVGWNPADDSVRPLVMKTEHGQLQRVSFDLTEVLCYPNGQIVNFDVLESKDVFAELSSKGLGYFQPVE